MIDKKTRRIFKYKTVSCHEVEDLFQAFFVSELLYPSKKLWLISPWVSDIPVIDNQTSKFSGLGICNPRKIRLVDILTLLMQRDVIIYLVVSHLPHNTPFVNALIKKTLEKGLEQNLLVGRSDSEHSKGILSNHQYYNGSMNITYNGIYHNGETLTFTIRADEIAQASIHFQNIYGEVVNAIQ